MKITATIITLNEAENISAAIESVEWADEILVVDSESNDATRDLAKRQGARVLVNPWPGFPNRNNSPPMRPVTTGSSVLMPTNAFRRP
jgi:glycosyltransferase involved in cell wall biosynthesis